MTIELLNKLYDHALEHNAHFAVALIDDELRRMEDEPKLDN